MIRIQNIYYMLAYAFQVLNEQGYRDVATEEFENTAELFAAILTRGISNQVKRGLGKEYLPNTESLSFVRGKINVSETVKTQSIQRRQLICSYDEFSVNSYMNRIIKSTAVLLFRSNISNTRKKELRKLLLFFENVEIIDLYHVNWNLYYNRNNQSYRMLIAICYLTIKGLLQTQSDGTIKMMDFLDEQRMSRLYERFILEYYARECPQVKATASRIPWVLDDGFSAYLPEMQSDITLTRGSKVLIIDAKYYSSTMQTRFGSPTVHSPNLYQIFTYVKNRDASFGDAPHEVSGLLLYAGTDESIQPDQTYWMSGNRISVRTLDLNRSFPEIAAQLIAIAAEHFGEPV